MPRQPLLLEEEPDAQEPRGRSSTTTSPFYCTDIPLFCPSFKFAQPSRIQIVGYTSGFLFTLAWWLFIGIKKINPLDGVSFASTRRDPVIVPIAFEDFVPGILSTISLIMLFC
jgi:hypothetical protein